MLYTYLEEIKAFLQREVCEGFLLKSPVYDDAEAFVLREPSVHIGWEPPQINSSNMDELVPCIIVGLAEEGYTDGPEGRSLPLELGMILYSPGTVYTDRVEADNTGYRDICNFSDKICRAFRGTAMVSPHLVFYDQTIKLKIETEKYESFWVGSVSLMLTAASAPREFLNREDDN